MHRGAVRFHPCSLRAADGCRPRWRWNRSSSCASLYAAESFAARIRPSAHPSRPPKGCRRTRNSIAVVPSFSIHLLLCSADFRQPPRSYEEIRLLRGRRPVVVAFFGSTACADPRRPPWVSSLDVPPLPPPIPPRPRMDFGRRVSEHADPAGPACTEVYFRSVLRFASGFFPTRPHGPRPASRDGGYCVQLPLARGCYHLAPRRTFTSNPVPMPGTLGHRLRRLTALTGVYRPASSLPRDRRQSLCQLSARRRICADSDRRRHM